MEPLDFKKGLSKDATEEHFTNCNFNCKIFSTNDSFIIISDTIFLKFNTPFAPVMQEGAKAIMEFLDSLFCQKNISYGIMELASALVMPQIIDLTNRLNIAVPNAEKMYNEGKNDIHA